MSLFPHMVLHQNLNKGGQALLVLLCGHRCTCKLNSWVQQSVIENWVFWWPLIQSPTSHITSQAGGKIWINICSHFIDDVSLQTPLISLAFTKLLNLLLIPKISFQSCIHTFNHFKTPNCRSGINSMCSLNLLPLWFRICTCLPLSYLDLSLDAKVQILTWVMIPESQEKKIWIHKSIT